MRNNKLFKKTRKLAISLIADLKDQIEKELPMRIEKVFRITEDGGFSYNYVNKPAFDILILRLQHRIVQKNEFKEFERFVEEDPKIAAHIGKNVGTALMGLMRDSWSFVIHILIGVAESYYQNKKFDERLFRKKFEELVEISWPLQAMIK
jgi:hypothetical protein